MHSPTPTLRHGLFIAAALALVAMAGTSYTQHVDAIFADGFEPIPNRPPVADAGLDQSATTGMPLSLDGSNSYDPDNDPLTYTWVILAAPPGSGAGLFDANAEQAILVADQPGDYEIQLTVFDGEYTSAPSIVTVTAFGSLPASAWIGPNGGAVGLPDGASVLIPPEALDTATVVSISDIPLPAGSILPPTGILAGSVYSMQPNGLTFNRPAQVIIPYDPASLPPGYTEGSVTIHRQKDWDEFDMVGSETGEEESHSDGQIHIAENHQYSALVSSFSAYAAVAVRSSQDFTEVILTVPTASIVVRRPPAIRTQRPASAGCAQGRTQEAIDTRTGNVGAIVIHSTNNGNRSRDFNGELGWAADDCNRYFAHYYIDRDGAIYQVVDDLLAPYHAGAGRFGITNNSSIGIELFLNEGEPFDGRQISSLIRLADFLMEKYGLDRPARDPTTGIIEQSLAPITAGGDRIVTHKDISGKCDPSGTFRDSGNIMVIDPGLPHDQQCNRQPDVVANADQGAPALLHIVLDAISVLARDRQHTGMINTHGGDSFETGQAGHAGAVAFHENPGEVDTAVGTRERIAWQENTAAEAGPGALVVADGATRALTDATLEYTDVIVAGTLTLDGDTTFHVTGTFYVSPTGKIIVRNGANGASLTVYSRGVPIIQGLIDTRGEDGVDGTFDGGNGGNVTFYYSAPGLLLLPTIYARGGDSDTANVSLPGGGPVGGNGGAITLDTTASNSTVSSHLFLGGGVGPLIGNTRVPTWRSATIDVALLTSRWAGDYLPPAPPVSLSSSGVTTPVNGQRVPKTWRVQQPGFARGLLTAGGMGGVGLGTDVNNPGGGPAGHGGNIALTLGTGGALSFRDIDIATGMEIETITHRFYLPGDTIDMQRRACTASGAHGGFAMTFGNRGGDGGPGGNAGAISITGGTFNPVATTFSALYEIKGIPAGQKLQDADSPCATGRQAIGHVVEARTATAEPLYRVRVNTARTALLGGHGGIPRGTPATTVSQGAVGPHGATAPITGS